jgi:hypothetical protein
MINMYIMLLPKPINKFCFFIIFDSPPKINKFKFFRLFSVQIVVNKIEPESGRKRKRVPGLVRLEENSENQFKNHLLFSYFPCYVHIRNKIVEFYY